MKKVMVWDPFVRLFHWTLVLAVIIQLVTAGSLKTIHYYTGYVIAALLILRIIWGFIGTKHARFRDFIYPPRDILTYFNGLVHKNPKNYLGHNPAGGAMVIVLLLVLCLTVFAGLKTLGKNGAGPFAEMKSGVVRLASTTSSELHQNNEEKQRIVIKTGMGKANDEFEWKEIHEVFVAMVLVLVVFHIGGVIASSYAHRENLILAMLTGKKIEK